MKLINGSVKPIMEKTVDQDEKGRDLDLDGGWWFF